ncbi:hypothetical protein AYI69_g2331 [Smittium culicis]|uniref:Transcription factor domain-containing protein n=1 Tax=Smittium culicis TaxID=133412 RepID=A0A1R1YMS5_9FUNG|nr:hypothetical protein AYI69_g2331 [Smittium culicis]
MQSSAATNLSNNITSPNKIESNLLSNTSATPNPIEPSPLPNTPTSPNFIDPNTITITNSKYNSNSKSSHQNNPLALQDSNTSNDFPPPIDDNNNPDHENPASSIDQTQNKIKKDSNRSKVIKSIEKKAANIKKLSEIIKKRIHKNFLSNNEISQLILSRNLKKNTNSSLNRHSNNPSNLYYIPLNPELDDSDSEDISLPSPNDLQDIIFSLIVSQNILMMPLNLSDFLLNLKNNFFPDYFLYSIIAIALKFAPESYPNFKKFNISSFSNKAKLLLSRLAPPYDLYYIWSSVLLSVFYFNFSSCSSLEFIESENPEFCRRIWWVCYITNLNLTTYYSLPQKFDFPTVFVNFPSNDLAWRYSGVIFCNNTQVSQINELVNSPKFNHLNYPDSFNILCRMYVLYSSIYRFTNTRWLNKHNDSRFGLDQFNKLSKKVSALEKEISSIKYLDLNYEIYGLHKSPSLNTQALNPNDSLKKNPFLIQEYNTLKFSIQLLKNALKISLFRSNLVRVKNRYIPPDSIKHAKNACIDASLSQALVYQWAKYKKNIPESYWGFSVGDYLFQAASLLVNALYLNDHNNKRLIHTSYDLLVKGLEVSTQKLEAYSIFSNMLQTLKNLKSDSHANNSARDSTVYYQSMANFSITRSDVNPWIVPRFQSYLIFEKCLRKNFYCLELTSYLGIDLDPTPSHKNKHNKTKLSINIVSPIVESDLSVTKPRIIITKHLPDTSNKQQMQALPFKNVSSPIVPSFNIDGKFPPISKSTNLEKSSVPNLDFNYDYDFSINQDDYDNEADFPIVSLEELSEKLMANEGSDVDKRSRGDNDKGGDKAASGFDFLSHFISEKRNNEAVMSRENRFFNFRI